MELVVFDPLYLNEFYILIAFLLDYLLIEKPGLLNRYDLVSSTMHHQYLSIGFVDKVNVGKMVFLELDIHGILVVEHAGK